MSTVPTHSNADSVLYSVRGAVCATFGLNSSGDTSDSSDGGVSVRGAKRTVRAALWLLP